MIASTVQPNTQAILLLTAPLRVNGREPEPKHLTPGEYAQLARALHERGREPADLLGPDASTLLNDCSGGIDPSRLHRLLARGLLLAQAIERWQARAIWVLSRADTSYPRRWKSLLRESAPPVIYGCGDAGILEDGGLAVVGSRDGDAAVLDYSEAVGRLAAEAGRTLVSGGARGIDQAAIRGALDAAGRAVAVLADSLERAAVHRDHREPLMSHRLVLVSPYDPAAGFHVGNAMQRNKLIYALADAALVVDADFEKGGTWTGAVEQLDRLRLVTMYVRTKGTTSKGLDGLRAHGALPWPEPASADALVAVLDAKAEKPASPAQRQDELPFERPHGADLVRERDPVPRSAAAATTTRVEAPAEELFAKVRALLGNLETPSTEAEIAADLQLTRSQAKAWLKRLVQEGVLTKLSRPVRYRSSHGRHGTGQ
jgi:DNA processing protein